MKLLDKILAHNRTFVAERKYEEFETTKFPDKKMVILTCMDTRLLELLPKAMNVKNGDVKIVKNAGAVVSHPFGSIMRSILVAVYQLKAEEIFVIGHYDCGMSQLNVDEMIDVMKDRGINEDTLDLLTYSGINVKSWLKGFNNVEENVQHSVEMIRNHPLISKDIPVHGLVIDPKTGALTLVVNGYE